MTAWLNGTAVEWKGSGYQNSIRPALAALTEKKTDKYAELEQRNTIAKFARAKGLLVDPSEIKLRNCASVVGQVHAGAWLMQFPEEDDEWGMVIFTNIRNFKTVPAPGLGMFIFSK